MTTVLTVDYRLPKFHAATCRFRLRIGFHHNRNGIRVERPFYWPAAKGETTLLEVEPHRQRLAIRSVTIREAINEAMKPFHARVTLKTDRRIETETAQGNKKNLCGVFGLSSSASMEVKRPDVLLKRKINVDGPLLSLPLRLRRFRKTTWPDCLGR